MFSHLLTEYVYTYGVRAYFTVSAPYRNRSDAGDGARGGARASGGDAGPGPPPGPGGARRAAAREPRTDDPRSHRYLGAENVREATPFRYLT